MSKALEPADPALIAKLEALIAEGGAPEFDPVELARAGRLGWSRAELTAALETLAARGLLTRVDKALCPVQTCGRPISEEDVAAQRCPSCTTDFRTLDHPEPEVRTVYRYVGPLSRDVQWAVVMHGMNTLGPWQEEFSWRLALKLRYSAPVLIHKYGLVRLGVLFRFRHRALVQALGLRLTRSFALAAANGRTQPPDIILHSFGTLLFAKMLDDPAFKALRFGRVVMAGSIVRPDHTWHRHIEAGRVEAVLNHCGARDYIVDLAAFAIPDTGPSGRVGIIDAAVINVRADGYDHSTFFQDRGLDESLAAGGLWDRFLRVPPQTLQPVRMDGAAARAWRPLPWPLRRIALPAILLVTFIVVAGAGWGAVGLVRHILG